jgi:DNA polymerase beta thumb
VAEAPALEGGPATLAPGGGLTVHLTDKRHYGMTLLLATGSAQHIDELRALAARTGLTLDDDGLRRGRTDRMCAGIACRHIEIATSRKWRVLPEAGIPFLGRVSRSKAKRITSSPCQRRRRAPDRVGPVGRCTFSTDSAWLRDIVQRGSARAPHILFWETLAKSSFDRSARKSTILLVQADPCTLVAPS